MKKISFIFGALLLGLTLNSCFSASGDAKNTLEKIIESNKTSNVEYDVITIDDLYSMKIPKFMTVTNQLQEDASLQYNNPFKEKYITVLDETREEIMTFMSDYGVLDESKSKLENYADTRLQYLAESGITIKKETKLKSKMINGRKALYKEIDATVPGISEAITYYFTYIEGKDHFYMITAWTLMDRKDAYAEEVEVMMDSFKEL